MALDVNANSPTEFYLVELLKVLVPVLGIALILVAVIRWQRSGQNRARAWLTVITAVWLLVTLADRLALSAPIRRYFISAAMRQYDPALYHEGLYFAMTEWLWTAEQFIVLAFGISLFLALRSEPSQHI